ncbi:hypothetical protein [Burkholderia seminalis]|uniref:hypothetical protein n=1 Tax=Burkholderia seminalis TaxID=488731 RepID=UPI001454699B|nr:hypothetical protein [Burkholderia seminalis]MCA8306714.1 hypothetical protein [Burkholderia seminalis]MCA8435141.1 hypothetical protein [Burkholderia seminalis]VWB77309.1 hypothetical protein BSE24067_03667 [Burkholderia seminalis]
MKRYRSIDYGHVVATADDHLIATPDTPRDAVPLALAQAARKYDGGYVENHCPECGEYASECSCNEHETH